MTEGAAAAFGVSISLLLVPFFPKKKDERLLARLLGV